MSPESPIVAEARALRTPREIALFLDRLVDAEQRGDIDHATAKQAADIVRVLLKQRNAG